MRRKLVGAISAVLLMTSLVVIAAAAPASAAISVGDESAFRLAFEDQNQDQIDLTADITLDDCESEPSRVSDTRLLLDGHDHTITQTCTGQGVLDVTGAGGITVQNITITGGDSDKATLPAPWPLIALMVAIEADNEADPSKQWPPKEPSHG